jgi:hypothetical protein
MKDAFYYLNKLEQYKSNPKFMKRFVLWGSVALGTLVVLAALAIWGAVSLFGYAASTASKVASSPTAQSYANTLKVDLQDLPKINALPCYETAQYLLTLGPWLEKPMLANLGQLKDACLPSTKEANQEEVNGIIDTVFDHRKI